VKIKLPIETERLVIRPLRLEDAEDLVSRPSGFRRRSTASSATTA